MRNDKIVFKDAHLIVDDKKEIMGASVLIANGKIEDVFYDFSKIKKDLEDYTIIDLNGKILMPSFFDGHVTCGDGIQKYGTLLYLSKEDDSNSIGRISADLTMDEKTKAIILNPNKDAFIAQEAKNKGIKILLGQCIEEVKKVSFDYDGFSNLFFESLPFDVKCKGLVNLALEKRTHSIEINASLLDDDFLDFILSSYPRDKVMFINGVYDETHNFINVLKRLKKYHYSYRDMVAYTSLNAHRFYGLEKRYSGILKGKEANVLILNEDLDLLYVMNKGKFL